LKVYRREEAENFKSPISNVDWITTVNAKKFYNKLCQEGFFWLAVVDGKIIGFCAGVVKNREPKNIMVGELFNIYVSNEYRSLGIGSEFVGMFKEYCKKHNCSNITVKFYSKNERAEKFYQKHGFGDFQCTYLCNI